MIKEEKEKNVEELQKVFAEAKGVYLTDFTGIDVQMINDLRSEFRKDNVNYRVVKNTLTLRSLEGAGFDDLKVHLVGPTALAFSYEDPLAPGKLIENFYKKNQKLELKAALIDGIVYDKDTTKKIVALPPKDQLIAKLLGTLNSPVSGLVYLLNGMLVGLVNVLSRIKETKEEQGGTPAAPEAADTPEQTVPEEKSDNAPEESGAAEKTGNEEQPQAESEDTPAVSDTADTGEKAEDAGAESVAAEENSHEGDNADSNPEEKTDDSENNRE
ncbi:50S ribosomal protein L10 [candidate division KSB1 bacterium]